MLNKNKRARCKASSFLCIYKKFDKVRLWEYHLCMLTKPEQGKPTVLTMGGHQLTKSWFSHIIKMQGDTTCVSVASTDYFGLSIMPWGHRRRGVYSPPFSFLENCNGRVKHFH